MKNYTMSDGDRSYIENKYHNASEPFNSFNRMAYHGYEYDHGTGLDDGDILAGLEKLTESLSSEPRPVIKARAIEYVLDNTRIDVNEHDWFVGIYSWNRLLDRFTVLKWRDEIYLKARKESGSTKNLDYGATGTAWIGLDFDHTVPDWDSLISLGFPGILKRAEKSYAKLQSKGLVDEKREAFYRSVKIEYEALLRFTDRLYRYSLTKDFEKAGKISECLKNLKEGAPQNTLDLLQMIYIYFMVSESVDHYQVRSLGYGLDAAIYPFFVRDIERGTFTREELTEFIAYFLMQFSSIGSYWGQPIYLAGTNLDGTSKVNEVTHLILDVYDSLGLYNPKLQIKVNKNTPKDFLLKALNMVRSGTNSMVFVNEDTVLKALMRSGATYEEALDSVIKGCYEYTTKANCIGISFNTFNALKPVALVFSNGRDKATGMQIGPCTGDVCSFTSFKEFYSAYLTQFDDIIKNSLYCLDYMEKYIHEVNPSSLYSATIPACMESMTDALDSGIKNVSDMLLNGFASAVDALVAVYELVYEKKVTSLSELKNALEHNWEGYELLRHRALNCSHKFGVGDKIADSYADAIHQFFASHFSGRKNCHGGNYEYELHSARAFIDQGKKTEATPDGRRDWDDTSKNVSPTVGMDKNGITALISSATSIDLSLSDSGACLDAMLHPSAVQGEDGLTVLYGVLNTYISKGGASIHFNIFDADTLREAQKYPEKYKNLQVRVCGWNVLWNNMAKSEQDEYIRRAENII
ncbi:MAG: hypothetical protein E7626_04365 [Ruminococcaceae bacterium]|nr:hypothetical protein [Oscillospiraceae bacterium]